MPIIKVDVELDNFSNTELLEEVKRRNIAVKTYEYNGKELIEQMYHKYRMNQPIEVELREFFWSTIGRIA